MNLLSHVKEQLKKKESGVISQRIKERLIKTQEELEKYVNKHVHDSKMQ